MAEDVVIVGGARTPFCEWVGGKRGDGKQGGLLKTVSAQNLGGLAIQGALEKPRQHPNSMTTWLWDMPYRLALNQSTVPDMQVFKVESLVRFPCSRSREFAVRVFNQL